MVAILDRAQVAQTRICVVFLLNDKILRNQSGLYYRNPPQLPYPNPGQLCSIVPVIKDQAQVVEKSICVDFLLNDDVLRNQSGLRYRYPSQLLYPNLAQLHSIVLVILDEA